MRSRYLYWCWCSVYSSGGQDRNALVEQQLADLKQEIDAVVAKIEEKEVELKALRKQLLDEDNETKMEIIKSFIEDLKQSIAKLEARLQSKEQERRELTQSLLGK